MGEIIDLAAGKGDEGGVIWNGVGVDGDEEDGEVVGHGGAVGRRRGGEREWWWPSVERF